LVRAFSRIQLVLRRAHPRIFSNPACGALGMNFPTSLRRASEEFSDPAWARFSSEFNTWALLEGFRLQCALLEEFSPDLLVARFEDFSNLLRRAS
jgi:hypothetical protein